MAHPCPAAANTVLVLLSLLAVGCGSSSRAYVTHEGAARPQTTPEGAGQRPGTQRLPTDAERAAIEQLMRLAEQVRGLRFTRPVPVAIEDAEAVMDYARSELRNEDFERMRAVYVALDMLNPELDVEALLVSLLGEQVVGYYDAHAGRLVVRDDVMVGLGEGRPRDPSNQAAREVLLHELVHALQDQHLGLSEQLDVERTSDEENAFRALVEGDATLSVAAFAARSGGMTLDELISDPRRMQSLTESIADAAMASPLLSEAPAILREPLLSAYRDGLSYAAALYAREHSFRALNAAHRNPPRSTEAVLHPGRATGGEGKCVLPALPALSTAQFTEVTTETLGELELRVYLAKGNASPAAARAADGWDGDQVRVFRGPQGNAVAVWMTCWDTVRDAREMYAASERAATARCASNGCTAPLLTRRGREVLVLHGVPSHLVAEVVNAAMPRRLDRSARAH